MNICPICRTGRLQKRSMVYVEWYGKDLLVVDRMPAIVCDICNEQIYDHDAIEILQRLLWSHPPNPARAVSSRNT